MGMAHHFPRENFRCQLSPKTFLQQLNGQGCMADLLRFHRRMARLLQESGQFCKTTVNDLLIVTYNTQSVLGAKMSIRFFGRKCGR
ncbi:hypothetical protein A6X21_13185 [Planctopirus hydrillae]|uniref:Uncharacterized protein n=1 Tax=Planctopirus hydrillae TaxID=1841610 RepID=A0A1C3E5V5_9PLAN|nr:hypothetical protein A6X21_13185 [Planctopirus hydrillae]